MTALVVLSLVFYKERVGYADSPGYLIDMTRDDSFIIAHSRFLSIGFEWLAYLLMKIHAPFRWLAIGYSLGHIFFPVGLSFITLAVFGKPYKALGILAFWVLMSAQLFYFTCSEFQLGLGLLLFYDAYADYVFEQKKSLLRFGIIAFVIILSIVFSHPVSVLAVAAWLIYRALKNKLADRNLLILTLVLTLVSFAVKRLFFISSYEIMKNNTIRPLSKLSFDIYHNHFAKTFYDQIVSDYFMVPILLVCAIVILILRKKKLLALFIPLTIAGFMGVVFFSFENATYSPYYEHFLQPISLFIILAVLDNFEFVVKNQFVGNILISGVFVIALCKIITACSYITKRQEWYQAKFRIMDSCGIRKALVLRDELPGGEDIGSYWNGAYETMFLSALDGVDRTKTIFMSWGTAKDQAMKEGDRHTLVFDSYVKPISDYPARYFNLGNEHYSWIKNDTCIIYQ